MLREGWEWDMKVGKVPGILLERLLNEVKVEDPRVLMGPRIGEDAALIDYGERLLVAKTDPVTFASDLVGWYAVNVNANDVACAGAKPKWFMASLLLPQTFSESQLADVFDQIIEACNSLGVTLVGGHSEITRGLTYPIVVGSMLGEVDKRKAVSTGGAKVGDSVVVTKGIALEGASLLARERSDDLLAAGVDESTICRATELLFSPGISVVLDALTACSHTDVHSLHDPTEGGLATGLRELAKAADVGLVIDEEKIPVLTECAIICRALGLDPLGLLASGCLVITLPRDETSRLVSELARVGVWACRIGEVVPPDLGLIIQGSKGTHQIPTFERDELARYFEP